MSSIYLAGLRRSGLHHVANVLHTAYDLDTVNNTIPEHIGDSVLIIEEKPPQSLLGIVTPEGEQAVNVIVVRDPFNLFASRIRHYRAISSEHLWINKPVVISCYALYLQALMDNTQLSRTTVYVNYNLWITDQEYRDKIINEIGKSIKLKPRTDRIYDAITYVDINGGGSSFDGRAEPDPQRLLTRYKAYWQYPAFRALFPEDLIKACNDIFVMDITVGGQQ